MTVYITGIPNAGKTTLFNGLTGRNERVGNWYGVTTRSVSADFSVKIPESAKNGCESARLRSKKQTYTAVDLPGSYFDGYTLEQHEVNDVIGSDGLLLIVCQAVNLRSGLNFLKKTTKLALPCAFIINAYGEYEKAGGRIDLYALRKILGIPVIIAECNKKSGVEAVKKLIAQTGENEVGALKDFDPDKTYEEIVSPVSCGLNVFDRLLLNPIFATLSILCSSVLALYVAFGRYGIGEPISRLLGKILDVVLISPIANIMKKLNASPFVAGFFTEGVFGGAVSILTFLPKLALLSLFTCIIEESGVLARLAYSSNGFLSRFGLNGRAIFALMTGFGCTAVATIASGGLENTRIRKRTVLALPFISCSAKVPVIAFLSEAIGIKGGFSAVLLIWITGFFGALLFSLCSKIKSGEKACELIVEFPQFRVPSVKTLLKALQKFTATFIMRVGSVITLVTAFLWILKSLSPTFVFLPSERISESILAVAAGKLQFVFYPAGVKNWRFVVAAIAGAFAKENVFSVLSLIGTGGANMRELIAFAMFFSLYPPCLGALSAIASEEGVKSLLHVIVFQSVIAFTAFYSVMNPLYLPLFGLLILPVLVSKKDGKARSNFKRKNEKIYGRKRNCTQSVSSR